MTVIAVFHYLLSLGCEQKSRVPTTQLQTGSISHIIVSSPHLPEKWWISIIVCYYTSENELRQIMALQRFTSAWRKFSLSVGYANRTSPNIEHEIVGCLLIIVLVYVNGFRKNYVRFERLSHFVWVFQIYFTEMLQTQHTFYWPLKNAILC